MRFVLSTAFIVAALAAGLSRITDGAARDQVGPEVRAAMADVAARIRGALDG